MMDSGIDGGGYYCGDEPEEEDSQDAGDDQEEFDCVEEDGEEDLLDAEEGEEETTEVVVGKDVAKQNYILKSGVKDSEVDGFSKVSTACTNTGDNSNSLITMK